MPHTRLNVQDCSFVYGEDQRIPLHVGGLALVESAPLRAEDRALDMPRIQAAIEARLGALPLFRKKLTEIPLDQGRPVWADDPDFRIENHVYEVGLPQPGTRAQLLELMGRMQSQVLDRNRPLWELAFVDHLQDEGSVAMIVKIHHSVVDGGAGVAVAKLLFDLTREGMVYDPKQRQSWKSRPAPGFFELLGGAIGERVSDAMGFATSLVDGARHPSVPMNHALNFLKVQRALLNRCDDLPFNGRVGSRRAFESISLSLPQAFACKDRFGVTLNELMLAVFSGAMRIFCEERGINPNGLEHIRAVCPVDIRDDKNISQGSHVSSLFIDLPVSEPVAISRIRQIAETSRELKSSGAIDGSDMWGRTTSMLPIPLLRLASRYQYRGLMAQGNILVSNIPGPVQPLYCVGALLRSFHPYFGVQDGLGINAVLFSYRDELCVGISADPELVPDLMEFSEALRKEFDQLVNIA